MVHLRNRCAWIIRFPFTLLYSNHHHIRDSNFHPYSFLAAFLFPIRLIPIATHTSNLCRNRDGRLGVATAMQLRLHWWVACDDLSAISGDLSVARRLAVRHQQMSDRLCGVLRPQSAVTRKPRRLRRRRLSNHTDHCQPGHAISLDRSSHSQPLLAKLPRTA